MQSLITKGYVQLFLLCAFVAAFVYVTDFGTWRRYVFHEILSSWVVREIRMEGLRHSTGVEEALGIERGAALSVLLTSGELESARRRLEALDWVEGASVRLWLSGRLHVRLQERRPVLRWRHQQALFLVDEDGVVLGLDVEGLFGDLPTVTGADVPRHVQGLVEALGGAPEVADRLRSGRRVASLRWDLSLENDVLVQLPDHDLDQALRWLNQMQKDHGVFSREIKSIDLRTPGQVIVRRERSL